MSRLPVPPLEQSLAQFLDCVRVLEDGAQYVGSARAALDFLQGDGPRCQAELEHFAEVEYEQGRNWMSEMWLDAYLAGRGPLTLVSNVGFELALDPAPDVADADRLTQVADLVARLAAVHLAWLRGEVEQHYTPRGQALCMQQWRFLAGGNRVAEHGVDRFVEGPVVAADRDALVLWQGNAFLVRVSDPAGRPLSRAAIREALAQVVAAPPASGVGFADLSYLDRDTLAAHQQRLFADPRNSAVHDAIGEAVFGVGLDDRDVRGDEWSRLASFEVGRAWTGKPVTYLFSLAPGHDIVGMHVEHSIVDGATLKTAIEQAQGEVATESGGEPSRVEPLAWQVRDENALGHAAAVERDLARVREASERLQIRTLRVETRPQADIGIRLSHDAGQQFVLMYAQLATFGSIRSTYEAVDMREYQAGRTECLRPNTRAAAALVTALRDGDATPVLLHAALAAHRDAVVACKTGQAFDRHLFALRGTASRLGLDPELFRDEGLRRLTTDFLSTTSLGDQHQIVRYGFAPTSPGGIGVNYTAHDGAYEYVLIADPTLVPDLDTFVANLHEGAARLFALVDAAAPDAQHA